LEQVSAFIGIRITGSHDNNARFWHIATGQEMVSIPDVSDARLAVDGSGLIALYDNLPSRFIAIPTFAEIEAAEKETEAKTQ
jgi:hypothetical protein